jgi:hypothetical protein
VIEDERPVIIAPRNRLFGRVQKEKSRPVLQPAATISPVRAKC